jgi:hypothetical protein
MGAISTAGPGRAKGHAARSVGAPRTRALLAAAVLVLCAAAGRLRSPADAAAARWEPLPPAPAGFQEGSGVRVGDEVWFIGGFPISSGHVWVFDLEAGAWRAGPPLPFALHHNMLSAFEHAGAIVVVGGMAYEGPAADAHRPHDGVLRLVLSAANASWEATPSPVSVGGMTQCTATPGPRGVRWCYAGSHDFHVAPFTFFEFDPGVMRARPLVPPPAEFDSSHVALLYDATGDAVHLLVGRLEGGSPASAVLVYDIAAAAWDLAGAVPHAALEGRAAVHLPGARVALLLGGQDNNGDYAGDAILQYDLAARAWAHVDDLPQRLLGVSAVWLGGGRVLVAGGGVGVGPKFSNRAYVWHAGALLTTPTNPRAHCAAPDDVRIVTARCGAFDVTAPLRAAVGAGQRAFAGAWCASAEAVGGGEPDVPRTLAVTFTRCGRVEERYIYCAGELESCRLTM